MKLPSPKSRKRRDLAGEECKVSWWPVVFFIVLALVVAGTVTVFQLNGSI